MGWCNQNSRAAQLPHHLSHWARQCPWEAWRYSVLPSSPACPVLTAGRRPSAGTPSRHRWWCHWMTFSTSMRGLLQASVSQLMKVESQHSHLHCLSCHLGSLTLAFLVSEIAEAASTIRVLGGWSERTEVLPAVLPCSPARTCPLPAAAGRRSFMADPGGRGRGVARPGSRNEAAEERQEQRCEESRVRTTWPRSS